MNCNPTLTANEFKTIHNALWELDCLVQRMDGVINQELFDKLYKTSKTIREGLKGAYEQDNTAFETKNNHYSSVQETNEFSSIWSMYEVNDMNSEHPYPEDAFVVYSQHWGDKPVHCAVYGKTWVDIYRAADNCIRNSGDNHHVFIENFILKNGNELHMTTGS